MITSILKHKQFNFTPNKIDTLYISQQVCQLQQPKKKKKKGYKFIHTGLVQVTIKPLTRKGIKSKKEKASILLFY